MAIRKLTARKKSAVMYDLWLYHEGGGWWLEESDMILVRAAALLAWKVGDGNTIGGAILPAGKPLGLFTKKMTCP